jgi:exodeoxyribonuclease V alpha subunit
MMFREGVRGACLRQRIIQLKNDYNREVFNGDLGIVEGVDVVEQELTISFDGRDVVYDFADLHEITLA